MSERVKFGGLVACLDCGGPMRKIQVNGTVCEFEMHPYCGPNFLNKKGEPLKHQPAAFLKAASLWAQQGQKIENGMCVWYHEPEMITEHIGGRHYRIKGFKPAVRGS